MTGGEALYADMGHFGPRPIRITWFAVVLPAFNFELFRPGRSFSSGTPDAAANPFYLLAPRGLLYPMSRIGDRRGDDRITGTNLGRLLAYAAGDPDFGY